LEQKNERRDQNESTHAPVFGFLLILLFVGEKNIVFGDAIGYQ
jgi:hypothetical protein